MKTARFAAIVLLLALGGCEIAPRRDVLEAIDAKRAKIASIVPIGMTMTEAHQRLEAAGFSVGDPYFPTGPRDYQVMLVTLDRSPPTANETFREVFGLGTGRHSVPRFLLIESTADGKITHFK